MSGQADPIARDLARTLCAVAAADIPSKIRHEASRALVNWLGCAVGGSRSSAVTAALRALLPFSGPPEASVFGHRVRADIMLAALLNCTSVGANAFDDCHGEMILHPTGPVIAAALAYAERRPVAGADLLLALVLGIEVECRLTRALALPPAQCDIGWYLTGITGGVGAAVAVGKLQNLSPEQMVSAMAIAAGAGSGFRALHGADTMPFIPAQAARAGLQAALLAEAGFTGSAAFLEPPYGMMALFSDQANAAALTAELGGDFEISKNTYKPFPCGIVIHALIEACLDLHGAVSNKGIPIERVSAWVAPATIALTNGQRHPADELAAMVSLHHWAAAALLDGEAGLAQGSLAKIQSVVIRDLRDRIFAVPDSDLLESAARVELRLADGTILTSEVQECVGRASRPMSDAQLDRKFLGQSEAILGGAGATRLLAATWAVETTNDVSSVFRAAC